MSTQQPVQELIVAGRLLMMMAARVSENLASFASWLIGSFAAVLGLLVANVDSVSQFLPSKSLGTATFIFLLAVGLHVIQRYLYAIVAGSVAASREAEELSTPQGLDFSRVMDEIERSSLWPVRILVARAMAKIRNGDFAAGGRLNAKLAQIQGYLVIAQMIIVVWAGSVLGRAL